MRRFVAPGPPIPPSAISSGFAENAWDFNDPNAMPGFGPLDCSAEQIDALVGRIVGGVRGAAESLTTAVADGRSTPANRQFRAEPLYRSHASQRSGR